MASGNNIPGQAVRMEIKARKKARKYQDNKQHRLQGSQVKWVWHQQMVVPRDLSRLDKCLKVAAALESSNMLVNSESKELPRLKCSLSI